MRVEVPVGDPGGGYEGQGGGGVTVVRSSASHHNVVSAYVESKNKAINWQIVAQKKLFSDLYRPKYTRPAYLGSCGLFKLI